MPILLSCFCLFLFVFPLHSDGLWSLLKCLGWCVSQIECHIQSILKLWIYEVHIFELQNEEINAKKILAVINATYAVAKRKPEKIRLAGTRTLTSAIPVQRSARGSSLHLFLHSAVQIYELHIFIISSSSFPGMSRTNLMTSSQLAC